MFHNAIPDFTAVTLIFLAAGAVKGILGMGLPTVAMGLLGLVMPLAGAASLLTVPSIVTNLWQTAVGPDLRATLRRLWPLQAGIVLGVAVAPWLTPLLPPAFGRQLLGVCLVAYGVLGLVAKPFRGEPARGEPAKGLLAGAATGVITGFTGVFVLPAVPYLQSLRLDREQLAQALGLCFTTSSLALAALLALQGHLDARASFGSLLMVLPALAGMWVGQRVRRLLSEGGFRKCFFGGLVLLGVWLLVR